MTGSMNVAMGGPLASVPGISFPTWLDVLLCAAIGANKETIKTFIQSGITMAYESCKYKAQQTAYEWDDATVEVTFGSLEGWKRPTSV